MPKNKTEKGLMASMTAAVEYAQGKKGARTKTIALAPPAPKWSRVKIVRLRTKTIDTSQSVFASLLNVSIKTVQSWEQGLRSPDTAACRTLELMDNDPEHFLKVVYAKIA